MKKKSFFLTFEGPDGVGKSTQIAKVTKWLRAQRIPLELTREPGGGKLAERIRGILLDPQVRMHHLTELFLYEAARAEHVKTVIEPALKKGRLVLCDRYTDATWAYQGQARGLSSALIAQLNLIATSGCVPDLTILLDAPPSQSFRRVRTRKGHKQDRLEKEGVQFQARVRQGYLALARRYPRRIKVVRVQDSIEATQALIRKIIYDKLTRKKWKLKLKK